MKLPDFTQFEPLNALRRMMGAELGVFVPVTNPHRLTVEEIEQLARSGIEVPLDQVRVLDDGTLAYKDSRVVLYIRDVAQYRHHVMTEQDMPRFHVSDCKTLQEMRDSHRFERYVVATRDDGQFELNIKQSNSGNYKRTTEPLRVCQNCLAKIGWEAFDYWMPPSRKKEIVRAFTLYDFFKRYGKTLIIKSPSYTADDAPLNDYTSDFKEVADRIKQQRGYRCDGGKCRLDLSKHPRFLHAHHINGIKSDNHPHNIRVLCIGCHAEEPSHGHMKSLPEYREFIRLYGNQRRT